MSTAPRHYDVLVIGGGVVGTAVAFTLAHRGVSVGLVESGPGLAYSASGTNSGCLHTGFDSTPGELETQLILRSAQLRPAVLSALEIPVMHCGAELVPQSDSDRETVSALYDNAVTNGVDVSIREADGALLVPGESITDPVAYTESLGRSAVEAGTEIHLNTSVTRIDSVADGLQVHTANGETTTASAVINCAGLYADEIARMVGDESISIYPRKGEFFVFELPDGETLDHIVLPVPTKRTKGVLVFPTLDGRVVTGPTAVDLEDKEDWSVREEARQEVLTKAVQQLPELEGLEPVFQYAGLRTAGRDSNYVIGVSTACDRLVNVAAIRSTGLSASLGIGEYVAEIIESLGLDVASPTEMPPAEPVRRDAPWWRRTADYRGASGA